MGVWLAAWLSEARFSFLLELVIDSNGKALHSW